MGDTLLDIFQQSGNVQLLMLILNSCVTIGAIAVAVFFSMALDIWSGPVALEQSRLTRYLYTSDSLIKNSVGQDLEGLSA